MRAQYFPRLYRAEDSTRERIARIITFLVVLGSTVFVIVQLRPGLLLSGSMDVGGDNAAHVAANYYFVHNLLPHLELSGWDPNWFGGFPLYVFYFPLPALLTAVLNGIMPFATAFKIVTVLGTILLPLVGYLFGRLAGFARPVPALMSAAMLAFLFNTSYTIDGGDILSTLAGEYSFSLSLIFALLFLGVLIHALRTGRLRWLAPILFALTLLCHVVPALFAAGAALVIVATWRGRLRAFRIVVPIGVVGALLTGFWLFRFTADLGYSSSMGYSRVDDVFGNLFPRSGELVIPILACVGAIFAVVRGQRVVIALSIIALGSGLAFQFLPSGFIYNARWLPFWFLMTALVAAYAVSELGELFLDSFGFRWLNATLTPGFITLVTVAIVAGYLGVLPFYGSASSPASDVPTWVAWNYSGYQAKPGWSNFQSLTAMLGTTSRQYGCGRLDYEYSPNFNDSYGSTLVPMSLSMWTNGCIQPTEGLYYESSTSNYFHFLDQAELSIDASNPVVGIPYQPLNVTDGIRHLQLSGVHYFLANSTEVESEASADPLLQEVAQIPGDAQAVEVASGQPVVHPTWILYLIKAATLVRPLNFQPVIEPGISSMSHSTAAINWYQDENDWPVVLTATGLSTWQHASPGTLVPASHAEKIIPTTVNDIRTTDSSISFNVGRIGSPVVVNIPFFPNWSATGASGPYYGTPNFMVVVPTSHHVQLTYETATADWIGRAASIVGLVGLFALRTGTEPDPNNQQGAPLWVERAAARRQIQRWGDEHGDDEGPDGPQDGDGSGGPQAGDHVDGYEFYDSGDGELDDAGVPTIDDEGNILLVDPKENE